MKKILLALSLVLIPSASYAQTATITGVRVLILQLAPGQDPSTATPVVSWDTDISSTSTFCNKDATPITVNPAINPAVWEIEDPFHANKVCFIATSGAVVIPISASLYDSAGQYLAKTCTDSQGNPASNCLSPRDKALGAPSFFIRAIQLMPVGPKMVRPRK